MSNRQIIQDAAECAKDRPLTSEESEAVAEALKADLMTLQRVIDQLMEAYLDDTKAGVVHSKAMTKAMVNLALYRVVGEAPL